MAEVRIAGLKQLLAGLAQLPEQLGKGAIYAALGGAGKAVKDEAVAIARARFNAGYSTGVVAKAIRFQRSKINRGQRGLWEVIVRVKPLSKSMRRKSKAAGIRIDPRDPFYWRYLEFGTSRMRARPFMRPGFEGSKDRQIALIQSRMRSGIERAARRIAERVNRAA